MTSSQASTHNTDSVTTQSSHATAIYILFDTCERILSQNRADNPDIYRLVDLKKQQAETSVQSLSPIDSNHTIPVSEPKKQPSIFDTPLRGAELRAKMRISHHKIRQKIPATHADIIPRTQVHNRKCTYSSVADEKIFRSDVVAAQIKSWRSILPQLIKRFSKIPDYRKASSIKHKTTVLMIFGLFAFIFRLSSRREVNRELCGALIFEQMKRIFPELDSIPHADTLVRLLERMDTKKIEEIHISLINDLIKRKKFTKLLIQGCLPITIDGSQKLYRQGISHDERWYERETDNKKIKDMQQYIYVLEANITLKNGLSIPLMTEYLYKNNNKLEEDAGKQDSEITAFERLTKRLKQYFPRLKIILFLDAMFATQSVMGIMHDYKWNYIISLSKKKLTNLASQLNKQKASRISLPEQPYYRKRHQSFYWLNDIQYGYEWLLNINLIACAESYDDINRKTGVIEKRYSEHTWISNIPAKVENLHELFNLGMRKMWLIEDSFNTEKNRGYNYKHAFSNHWNAMQGFHLLMRLAHAINALSEFTKSLKKYIHSLGCSATMKLIKETLFSPWLSLEWYDAQSLKKPQLRLQLE